MRLHLFVGVEVFSRLCPRRQTTSPLLPSTIHHSIPQSIEMQSFLADAPGGDGSPPTLSHSNSVLYHSLLRSAKPSARREEAPARLTQLLLFLNGHICLNRLMGFTYFLTETAGNAWVSHIQRQAFTTVLA